MRVLGLLILVLALTPAMAGGQGVVTPDRDAFYAAPDGLAAQPNGAVLKQRDVVVPIPTVHATQIQYRSTDAKGAPIAPVTTLLEPVAPYVGGGPRPLVAYQVGYDSLGAQCMPSYTLRAGNQPEIASMATLLQLGYAVTASDYEGPRNAWTAGPLAGHVVLDGIRAAQTRLSGTTTPTALLGYAGGGQATAWAAEQVPVYAPELRLAGVAAGGVTPDPEQLIRFVDGTPAAGLAFAALAGLERQFPQMYVRPLLNATGQAITSAVGGQCASDIASQYGGTRLIDTFADPTLAGLQLPRVQHVFEVNRLGKNAPSVPVYLWHSAEDEQVPVAGADGLAATWCRRGAHVYYDRMTGDHADAGLFGGISAMGFIAERFRGEPPPGNCGSTPRATIASYCPGGATTKFRLHRIHGEKIQLVQVFDDDGVQIFQRGGDALRRIVLRHLVPGLYRFTVTRTSFSFTRTRAHRREVVCKIRAI